MRTVGLCCVVGLLALSLAGCSASKPKAYRGDGAGQKDASAAHGGGNLETASTDWDGDTPRTSASGGGTVPGRGLGGRASPTKVDRPMTLPARDRDDVEGTVIGGKPAVAEAMAGTASRHPRQQKDPPPSTLTAGSFDDTVDSVQFNRFLSLLEIGRAHV